MVCDPAGVGAERCEVFCDMIARNCMDYNGRSISQISVTVCVLFTFVPRRIIRCGLRFGAV